MSVEPTSLSQAEAWRARSIPAPEEVRPGLWAIAVPVPTPIRYTICYALEAPRGLMVIDPGWPDDAARRALIDGLAAMRRSVADVVEIVVTHLHPDHAGLANWLLGKAPRARLRMHSDDLDRILPGGQRRRAVGDRRWSAFMGTVGAPPSLEIGTRVSITEVLPADRAERACALADGERLRHGRWELSVIWTPGHTPGSLVLLDSSEGLLFSGDSILPTVTPAVTQQAHAEHDVLGQFLSSLAQIRDLPVDEVLPGHQYRFRGLRHRVDEMQAHHDLRLADLVDAVGAGPGATCYDLAQRVRWSTNFDALSCRDRAMAARETLAHLTHLRLAGRITARSTACTTSWYTG